MVSQQLKSTTTPPILPKVYEKYYGISQNFHHTQISPAWLDFNLFMYEVGDAAIEEALIQPKKYGPDGRFYNLLRFRYIDFLRKHQPDNITSIKENKETVEVKNTTIPNLQICFDKAIGLINGLLKQVDDFTDGQIATKFIDIAGQFSITHFLGVKINEVEAISKMQNKTRQNRSNHRKKFRLLISNIKTNSYSKIDLDTSEDYKGIQKEAIKYFEKGLQYRYEAKEFENTSRIKLNVNSFFKCFLCYLKASFCFKKAIEIDVEFDINRYNYAYVLKRLGFLNEAIVELNELCSASLPKRKKAMVLECLGNTYSLEIDNEKAINYFEAALQFSPGDIEIIFNLLEAYEKEESNYENKIISKLNMLIKINQKINNPDHLMLINKLKHSNNKNIIKLTYLIISIK